jgi:hypothetical protein
MAGDVQLGLQNRAAKPSLCFGRESWVMKRIKEKKEKKNSSCTKAK